MKELEFKIKKDSCYIILNGKVIEVRHIGQLEEAFDKYLQIKKKIEQDEQNRQ